MSEKFEKSSTTSSSLEEQRPVEAESVPFVKSEAEKRLVRKLNWRLLPLAGIIVFLQVYILICYRNMDTYIMI
jgi:hypothetical protein